MSAPTLARRQFHHPTSLAALVVAASNWLSGHTWLFLLLLAIPACWPLYAEGLPRSFDGQLHLLRLGLLDTHLRDGVLYPRWLPELMLGHGYPLFSFYGPGSYYLAESFHLLGMSFYVAFAAALALLVLVAGYGMFILARDIYGERQTGAAIVAATAYMYAPYLLTNVYIRGALAETAAQALLPWILWSARRLLLSERPACWLLPFAFSLAGLAVTHTISLLLVPPVLVVYMALLWWHAGRSRARLPWAVLALLSASGLSAFFWLPLAFERGDLAETAYQIARSVWLPRSVWTWQNFLDTGLTYTHTFARPVRLGLAQLLLAVAGLLLAGRRDREWLFFAGVALGGSLCIGAWSLPLWLSSDLFAVVQFPWRLLILVTLPLALFAGAPLSRVHRPAIRGLLTLVLLAILVAAQRPRLGWIDVFSEQQTKVSPAVAAQFESDQGIDEGGEGTSALQEFRPRWADPTLVLQPVADRPAAAEEMAVVRGNILDLEIQVQNARGGPLRFSSFYMPGWEATLDGKTGLQTYPSTNLGLLTVDLPPGDHTLRVVWAGTPLQRTANTATLFTLGLLVLAYLVRPHVRWLAAAPAALLAVGVAGIFWTRPLAVVEAPQETVAAHGVQLVGYRTETAGAGHLTIYPYWSVSALPPAGLRATWQVQDTKGAVLSEVTLHPYFNAGRASNWPPSTLVDDAYVVPLPPGLPAGTYQLALRLQTSSSEPALPATPIGVFSTSQPVPLQPQPVQSLEARFGDAVRFAGYDVTVDRLPESAPLVVRPGGRLEYTLYWQAIAEIPANYHGFVHLIDEAGRPLVQEDHLPGPNFHPPRLWDPYYLVSDHYLLRIPDDAPAGLYWPTVGMYIFESGERLPSFTEGREEPGDHVRLPPIKVLRAPADVPAHRASARLGDFAVLQGYDLDLPETGLRPGDAFTVTLQYRTESSTSCDYTRFLHVADQQDRIAAQHDSPPAGGANPTWSWVPGEIVTDQATLVVSRAAHAGQYTLYLGFYEVERPDRRLPLTGPDGLPLPDARLHLATVEIKP